MAENRGGLENHAVCRMAPTCKCVLAQWQPTRELSPSGSKAWMSAWRVNRYERGNVLFYQGNLPAGLYFVCSGLVKLVRAEGEARQQIVRVIRGPALLGERALVAGDPYEATGEVAEDAHICFMSADRFLALWNSEPGVARLIARHLAHRLGQAQATLAEMGLRTLRERLARLIARGFESEPRAAVPLGGSRKELAELLGTSPEVVCRALAELEKKGVIRLEGRFAAVRDEPRLRAIAGLPPRSDAVAPPPMRNGRLMNGLRAGGSGSGNARS